MVPPIEYPKKVKQTDKKQTLSGSVTPTLQISNLFQLVLQMATKLQLKARLAFTLQTTGKKDKCKLPLWVLTGLKHCRKYQKTALLQWSVHQIELKNSSGPQYALLILEDRKKYITHHWRDCSSKRGLGELGAGEGRRADDKSWDFHLPHKQY